MMTSELKCPDGYVLTHVPLSRIKFINPAAVEAAAAGLEAGRYAAYLDTLSMGHSVNGAIIVYRTPKGNLFASDLRHSELVVLARRKVKFDPKIDRHVRDPHVSVKIIEVESPADIPVQREKYLEKNK